MNSEREENLLRSVTQTTGRFYLWVAALSVVVLWGLYAYIHQLRQGLIVTGMRDQVSWGLYITNFVFFIGISHAGTLISAILRVTGTEWRRPITRLAEAITVFALCIGAPMVIVDLGRPERLLNIFRYGRIQSPILWDVLSVSTYLAGCILYLYLPMIPDLAVLAQRQNLRMWRRRLYRALSLGWTGSAEEQHLLEKSISLMAVIIIPLAISVHTVVSWIFAMTLRPGWNSSIFGPYFVVGAIYSGAAAVVLSMYVLRRVCHLEDYLEPIHFRNLGLLLLSFCLLYLYFNINEYLTLGYKFEGMEKVLLRRLFFGDYAAMFWSVQAVGVFLPMFLMLGVLALKRYRQFTIPGVALAAFLVVVGAWAKRYLIVIPTLLSSYLPAQRVPESWTHYRPTWVEWSVTAAAVALFLLIYAVFSKLFPMVSVWETREAETLSRSEPAVAPAPRRWGSIPTTTMILLSCLLGGAGLVHARETHGAKKVQATALVAEWRVVPAAEAKGTAANERGSPGPGSARVQLFLGRIFGETQYGSKDSTREHAPPATIAVSATLRDAKGLPLAFQPVSFALKTSFGTVSYGSRPTNAEGKAELLVRDRRYGRYPVELTYEGGEGYTATRTEIPVDFGPRPTASLPPEGVLITPYATPAIGLPFLFFYGLMWVVYSYAFGYLVLWRMRRSRVAKAPAWQRNDGRSIR
jgi:molybdopterin-containing oxidoreductase family membrane subunit